MTTQPETYIPLEDAARKYGVPVEALTQLVRDGIIKLAHTREEGSVITVSTVDNETAARMILEEIRLEQYKHLRGRKIRVTEAAERYGVNQANLSRWADSGYIHIVKRQRRLLLLDEADVKLAADIFKRAHKELSSSVRAGWVLKRTIKQIRSQAV